ncbi:MAG: hypothetical protein CMO26_24000 [Thiotrichales bacterium]|nr:hypothetical protein [Thiotrichales bacterium]
MIRIVHRSTYALRLTLTLTISLLVASHSYAQTQPAVGTVSANDFGGIGLLQTRTARFGKDGSFEIGTTFIEPYRRWYFRLTLLPWFEGTFRYTDVRNRLFSNIVSFSGNQSFKDRGADIKFRLWPESRLIPQIAVGMQDGLGTGLFRGEYFVASKRFRDLDFSFGLGWGYLGNGGTWKNPLTFLSDALSSRSSEAGTGGVPLFGSWFSGEFVSPFFGVEYQTPITGLSLKAEYEGNDYQTEPLGNVLEATSPWNYGINYRPFSWLDISLAFERGTSYMSRIALLADLHDQGLPKFDPPPPSVRVRGRSVGHTSGSMASVAQSRARGSSHGGNRHASSPSPAQIEHDVDKLFAKLEQAGLEVQQLEFTHEEARVHFTRGLENALAGRAEQLASTVIDLVPTPIERVKFIDARTVSTKSSVVVSRNDIARNAIVDYLFDGLEAEGIHPQSLEITHDAATLTITADHGSSANRDTEIRAAQAVLQASPTPIQHVTIISAIEGLVRKRITFHRDEVHRDAAIEDLFESVDADGFQIDSLEISHEKATIYVATKGEKSPDEYVDTAYTIANAVPVELREVRIVDLHDDSDLAAATLRRDEMGWSAVGRTAGASTPDASKTERVAEIDTALVANQLFEALAEENLIAEGVQLNGTTATIYLATRKFRQFAKNIGRAARVAANVLPDSIEEFAIVYLSSGMEMNRVKIWRKDLEQVQLARGSLEEIWVHTEIGPPQSGSPQNMIPNPDRYPHFEWGIGPGVRQHVGGPSKFILYQVWARANARLDLMPGLFFTASYGHNLYNNFDRIRLESDSVLSHVRSDIKEYLQQGESALVLLQGDYVFSPASQVFARLSAGLFEEMYGGVSSEILYRPFNSRLAIGAEFNWVRQREFDVKFKFRNYNTGTGHLNIYYQWPWYRLLTSMHIGKYLARDRGGTVVMSREFDSGVRMGAWVTLTNIPYEEFGEGSFDKGIYVSIPFELFLMKSTTGIGQLGFRPLTRDGGQMVHVSTRLYDLTADANLGRVVDDWDRLLD